jgi:hypothetical protein
MNLADRIEGADAAALPIYVTVDFVFELLDNALAHAIEQSGNRAKSVAWDVRGHFLREIGHQRTALRARGSE